MTHRADIRYAAIGDSFSEGVGDELADGSVRGWTDLVAHRWASVLGEPIQYASFAIRGKLIAHIVEEQLEAALELGPTHVSFNGGGNDMLRPRADLERILGLVERAVDRCTEAGAHLLLVTGGNPCERLPLGNVFQQRGDVFAHAIADRFAERAGVTIVQNWFDTELASTPFWTQDRLHMNTRGHHRVAARMLTALGLHAPHDWSHVDIPDPDRTLRGVAYYGTHVGPWIKRRLTGTSSGDGRVAKHPDWVRLTPGSVHASV